MLCRQCGGAYCGGGICRAEVEQLRQALSAVQLAAASLRDRARGAETRVAAAERAAERVAGLERRLRQEMGCREASDRRAAEAEARLAAADRAVDEALAEVARLRRSPLSCPFCGSTCRTEGGGPAARPWFVLCDSLETCGVMGPNHRTEAEAVQGWAAIRVAR